MPSGSGALGRFIAALRACGVQPHDGVAVALSGGPDSLALASMTAWWHGFARRREPPLALIVDHRLRPESGEEAVAVARQAEELGLQARVLAVDWPAGQLPSPGDKMAAARDARYALLLRACREAGRGALLLGHHADDQAETFLLRLMHASGVLGLACMPRVAEHRTDGARVRVVRPLLDFRKRELEEYCQERGLDFVVDPTNAELSFHRNRIRHVLQQAAPPLQGAGLAPAGGGAQQPPAGSAAQQDEAVELPRSGGSSGLEGGSLGDRSSSSSSLEDGSSSGLEGSGSSGRSSSSSLEDGSSSSAPSITDDILRLQRRCAAAAKRQRALGDDLLRRAVLRTSAEGLPAAPRPRPFDADRRMTQAELRRHWLNTQSWYLNWDKRLSQVASALRWLRFALLDASCFRGLREAEAAGALSRILQAVAGRTYPPPLSQSVRLHTLLLDGRLDSTYTGGGCLVRRLARSKGRYLLCVAERDWPAAEAALARLPPPTADEVARWRRKQQERAAATGAGGDDGAAAAAAAAGGGGGAAATAAAAAAAQGDAPAPAEAGEAAS